MRPLEILLLNEFRVNSDHVLHIVANIIGILSGGAFCPYSLLFKQGRWNTQ